VDPLFGIGMVSGSSDGLGWFGLSLRGEGRQLSCPSLQVKNKTINSVSDKIQDIFSGILKVLYHDNNF